MDQSDLSLFCYVDRQRVELEKQVAELKDSLEHQARRYRGQIQEDRFMYDKAFADAKRYGAERDILREEVRELKQEIARLTSLTNVRFPSE